MTNLIYTDGSITKSFDRAIKYPDEAWAFLSEPPEMSDHELYASVAAIYRAANLCADTMANLPFALVTKSGEDYDTSEDWQNKVGFLPNPSELFRLWRLSLYFTNTAYGFMETERGRSNLRYIVPTTINPVQSKAFPYELTGFKRTVGPTTVEYPLKDKRIVYIWRLDHTTELIPTKMSEYHAAATAAGVLYFSDYYIRNFFARGGIKPTMLMVKGAVNPAEREKIENVWDKVIRGYYKFLGKIFNAEAIEAKVIGDGIENLKDDLIYQNKLADIAMASGLPLSLLLSNSANYATAQTEYMTWFRDSVEPWANFIAHQFTYQVLAPLGLKLDFRPELTDPGQESEVARAEAFSSYVASGIKPSVAAQIVGIDLPPGVEYDDLDPEEEPEPEAPPVQQMEVVEEEEPEPIPAKTFVPSIDQYRELEFWQTLAFRRLKRGESVDFDFRYKTLPASVVQDIQAKLADVKTDDDIRQAFDLHDRTDEKTDKAIIELAEAMNRAADALYKNQEKPDENKPIDGGDGLVSDQHGGTNNVPEGV